MKPTLKLLVIINGPAWTTIQGKLAKIKWDFSPKVDFQIDLKYTAFTDIPFETYQATVDEQAIAKPLGIDRQWYDINVTALAIGYDIVLFVVQPALWPKEDGFAGWRTDNDEGPVELQIVADENTGNYSGTQLLYTLFQNRAEHEIMHALFVILGGIDTTHQRIAEGDMFKALGDLGTQQPDHSQVVPKLKAFIARLQAILTSLLSTQPANMSIDFTKYPKIIKLCNFINQMEGPNPDDLATRNNNPGNIRCIATDKANWNHLAVGTNNNFCVFKTEADGWYALREKIYNIAIGKSVTYCGQAKQRFGLASSADLTLLRMFEIYAPASDSNDPVKYAHTVASELGVDVTYQLKQFLQS